MGILHKYFSESDLTEIKEAVASAEKTTSAEIVPYFAESSHHYKEWIWLSSFIGGAFFGLGYFLYQFYVTALWGSDVISGILSVWSGACVGLVLAYVFPKVRFMTVGKDAKRYFVNLRAKEAFLDEEVFNTKSRTGILIYISLREHFVRVLPDKNIAKIVPQSEWDEAVRLIIDGMKFNKKKQGIISSILFCGDLLNRYKITIEKNDTNELSNEVRDGGKLL